MCWSGHAAAKQLDVSGGRSRRHWLKREEPAPTFYSGFKQIKEFPFPGLGVRSTGEIPGEEGERARKQRRTCPRRQASLLPLGVSPSSYWQEPRSGSPGFPPGALGGTIYSP